MVMLYAYGAVLVKSGEWPILVACILSQNEFAHLPLRTGWDTWQDRKDDAWQEIGTSQTGWMKNALK